MDDRQYTLYWVGSSRKNLKAMPSDVQDVFSYALHLAQLGKRHALAKPLKGFAGATVVELALDHTGDAFRAVYCVVPGEAVYVLHCFKKKSKQGIHTPKRDIDLIKERLRSALTHAEEIRNEKH